MAGAVSSVEQWITLNVSCLYGFFDLPITEDCGLASGWNAVFSIVTKRFTIQNYMCPVRQCQIRQRLLSSQTLACNRPVPHQISLLRQHGPVYWISNSLELSHLTCNLGIGFLWHCVWFYWGLWTFMNGKLNIAEVCWTVKDVHTVAKKVLTFLLLVLIRDLVKFSIWLQIKHLPNALM